MNPLFVSALATVGLLSLAGKSLAVSGDVDLSFNPGLRVNDYVYAIAAQPDGKVVIGGLFTSPGRLIARLNPDGSVDPTFNAGTGANGIIYSIAMQTDGKIVVGGAFSQIDGINRNRIARLNADGSLDLTFDPGTGTDGRVRAVAVFNGKILIGGDFYEVNQVPRVRIARLNSNGSVDNTFNSGSGADLEVLSLAVQTDGRILIGGYFLNVNDVARNYLCRLNSNGTVDENFDPGQGPNLDVDTIALQSDGRIIIGGGFDSVNGYARGKVARLDGAGNLDETFDPGTGADFHVSAVAVQSNGGVVVGGNFGSFNGIPRGNIVRLKTDGGLDDGFNPGNGTDGGVYALAVQAGKVVVGGTFRIFNGVTRNYIMRLDSVGALDPVFEPNTGADYPVLSVAAEESGRVLMGGYFTIVGGVSRHYVARLNADGRLDLSFTPGTGPDSRVLNVLPVSEGKTIIGGLFTTFNGTNRAHLARLNSDGNLDLAFNPGLGANANVLAIALQSDGKVIAAGDFTSFDGTSCGSVIRLEPGGTADFSFNTGMGATQTVKCVLVQPDGKILIGGDFLAFNGTPRGRIARLNSNGSLDSSFNPGTGANGTVECLAVQRDGGIIVGGQFSSLDGISRGRLARLDVNGRLDTNFTANADGSVLSVAVNADDRIVVGGEFFTVQGISRPRIARLHANGTVDLTFDPGVGANDIVNTVVFQTDGQILAGGFFNTMNGVGRSSVARLESDLEHPSLKIRRVGESVVASWPAVFNNFTLECTTNIARPDTWNDPGRAAVLLEGEWVVTNSIVGPAMYFRLESF